MTKNNEGNVLKRVIDLPLVSSALQQASTAYMGVKHRYPLLGFVGGVAELGVRSASKAALKQAAPFLQNLEPEIEAANSFALVGLEQLEKFFPVLQQHIDEVVANLRETFFSRLDDAQSRVNDELSRALDRWDTLLERSWRLLAAAQDSAPGRVIISGLDEFITQSEAAVAYYLPLPATLHHEWEIQVQSYEDDNDENEEPFMWTRIRSLWLFVYLQLYYRVMDLRERVDGVLQMLGEVAEKVGLMQLMEMVSSLLQFLLMSYTSQALRAEELRSLLMAQLAAGIQTLKSLPPVQQVLALPAQVSTVANDLLELGQILIQLLINTTPLYDLVKQVSDPDGTNNPIPDELPESSSSRTFANSLFLRAMDGRPRRRRSLYTRSHRESASASGPAISPVPSPVPTTVPANGRKVELKVEAQSSGTPEIDTPAVPPAEMINRRSSATEVLMAPIMQLVTQSQRAFEFLSSGASSEDQVTPVVETTEH